MSLLSHNYYTVPADEAPLPAVAAFNTAPTNQLNINRLWARYLVSWLSQMATDENWFEGATEDAVRQNIHTTLNNFIAGL